VRKTPQAGGILKHFRAIQKISSPIHCLFPTLARPILPGADAASTTFGFRLSDEPPDEGKDLWGTKIRMSRDSLRELRIRPKTLGDASMFVCWLLSLPLV
jgi:hypothetical protein